MSCRPAVAGRGLVCQLRPVRALDDAAADAAGVRAVSQVLVLLVLASILGVRFRWEPLGLLGAVAAVMLGSAFLPRCR